MPTDCLLTLCVIVRDEAGDLAELLASTRNLWDECVVVDTGSRDDSATVAASAGARVIRDPWRDDFSAARNRGLEEACGRWILVMDCDERMAARHQADLRQQLRRADEVVWTLPQWNLTDRRELPDALPVPGHLRSLTRGADTYVVAHQIRLFPRRDDLRYAGKIHEGLDQAVMAAGLPVECLDAPIIHFGHLPELRKNERRNGLYARLLREKIRENPQDPLVRYELAVQLANEGHLDQAERLLVHTVRNAPGGTAVHKARLLLGRLLHGRGETAAGARQVAHAVRERPDQQACWVAAVQLHAAAGLDTEAQEYLRQGLGLFPHDGHLRRLKDQDNGLSADNNPVPSSWLSMGTAIAKVRAGKPVESPDFQAGRP